MHISPIGSNTLFFSAMSSKKPKKTDKFKKNADTFIKDADYNSERYDVYYRKLSEIYESDPNFKPNKEVAQRVKDMKKQKLSIFDSSIIKEILSSKTENTKRAIQSINTVERFSAEELKKLMSDSFSKRELTYLMSNIVPASSIENSEVRLRQKLGMLKIEELTKID